MLTGPVAQTPTAAPQPIAPATPTAPTALAVPPAPLPPLRTIALIDDGYAGPDYFVVGRDC